MNHYTNRPLAQADSPRVKDQAYYASFKPREVETTKLVLLQLVHRGILGGPVEQVKLNSSPTGQPSPYDVECIDASDKRIEVEVKEIYASKVRKYGKVPITENVATQAAQNNRVLLWAVLDDQHQLLRVLCFLPGLGLSKLADYEQTQGLKNLNPGKFENDRHYYLIPCDRFESMADFIEVKREA